MSDVAKDPGVLRLRRMEGLSVKNAVLTGSLSSFLMKLSLGSLMNTPSPSFFAASYAEQSM